MAVKRRKALTSARLKLSADKVIRPKKPWPKKPLPKKPGLRRPHGIKPPGDAIVACDRKFDSIKQDWGSTFGQCMRQKVIQDLSDALLGFHYDNYDGQDLTKGGSKVKAATAPVTDLIIETKKRCCETGRNGLWIGLPQSVIDYLLWDVGGCIVTGPPPNLIITLV